MADTAIVGFPAQNDVAHLENSGVVDNLYTMSMRLEDMRHRLKVVQEFFKDVMVKGVDYGVIPGTHKPTLYKSGAEKLCELYNFAIVIASKEEEKDLQTGYYRARIVIRLVHRGTGALVAEGTGEASVFESKYRWRWVYDSDLPKGIDKDSLVYEEFESKNGGTYKKYRIENPNLYDQWNTVLKMAKKRALVDATLSATRSSGIFSQAENALDAWIEGEIAGDPAEHPDDIPDDIPKQQNTRTAKDNRNSAQTDRAPAHSNEPATDRQIKAIFASSKSKGLSSDEIKKIIYNQLGREINDLTQGEASDLIKNLNNAKPDEIQRLKALAAEEDAAPPALYGEE